MPGQYFRQCENICARTQDGLRNRLTPGESGKRLVQVSEPGDRERAVALRHADERGLEIAIEAEPAGDRTQPVDFGSQRERRQQLGAS